MKSEKFSVYLNVGAYEIAVLTEDNAEWRQGDSKGLWEEGESSPSTYSSSPYSAYSGLKPSQTEALVSLYRWCRRPGSGHDRLSLLPSPQLPIRHTPSFLVPFRLFTLWPAWSPKAALFWPHRLPGWRPSCSAWLSGTQYRLRLSLMPLNSHTCASSRGLLCCSQNAPFPFCILLKAIPFV